jgi:hypothetical protein
LHDYYFIKYIFLRLRRKQIKLFLSGKSILMKLLIIFFGKKKFGDFRTNFNTETFFRDKDFFQVILGASGIVYFLSPYEPDKMSYWLDSSIDKHLFNPDETEVIVENTKEEQIEVQKLLFGELEKGLDSLFEEITNDDDDIEQLKSKAIPKVKTMNQLLDKIIDEGYSSLSDSDLKLLNEYSKK